MDLSEIKTAVTELTTTTHEAIADLKGRLDKIEIRANRPGALAGGAPITDLEARTALGTFAKTGEIDTRSMSVGVADDGGFIVPPELDKSILQLQRNMSPIRRIAQVVQTTASVYQRPVNLGGTASGWVDEKDARPETATPKLSLLSFPAGEVYANPAVTQRLLDDSPVNVAQFLEGEIAKEFDAQEGSAFLTGDGVNKPRGLLTAPNSADADGVRAFGTYQFVNSGDAAKITADGLIDFTYRLKAGYRQNARWLMNSLTASALRQIKDANGQYVWIQSYAAGQPSTLLGYPVEIDENMPNIAANALPIAFGDFHAGYLISDRVGIRILRDPYSAKPYVHFYSTKRVGGGPLDTQAIKFLKIAA